MKTLKSIGAVLGGLVAIFALSHATDTIMETTGVFPPFDEQMRNGMFDVTLLGVALAYRLLYSVAGCALTAFLAPNRPMRHALILGGIGVILSTMGLIFMWDKSPAWYPVALVVFALPCAWLGGKLKTWRTEA